jgi:hypothetical protein
MWSTLMNTMINYCTWFIQKESLARIERYTENIMLLDLARASYTIGTAAAYSMRAGTAYKYNT